MPLRAIFLFTFLVGSLPICFMRPFYGILLWYVIAFSNPQSALFYWKPAEEFQWAVAVAIPTLLGLALFSRNWFGRLRCSEVAWMITLWTWFTITAIISVHTPMLMHHEADTWTHWGTVSKMLLMTAVTIAVVDSIGRLRTLIVVMSACLGFYVLKAVPFLVLTHGTLRVFGPQFSMIADNNDFGLAVNMTMPLFFVLAQTDSRRWVRWLYAACFFASIPVVFFTYSRGALIGLVVLLALMVLRGKRHFVLMPVIILALILAVLFAPPAWKERMNPSQNLDLSARSRLNAWAFSWNFVKDFPLTGGGFATFTPQLYDRYAPDHTLEIVGPHSIYFELMAEHGFIGLGLYLAFVTSCFLSIQRFLKLARWHEDDLMISYLNMIRFSMVAFLVSGTFLQRAYFDYFFCVVACLAILKRLALQRWDSAEFMVTEPAAEEMTPREA